MRIFLVLGLLMGAIDATGAASTCGPDSVVAGTVCLDRYEATVWRVPQPATTNAPLVRKIQQGLATVSDLRAGGATQLGTTSDDYSPCTDDGQHCADDVYAVSLPSVNPSAFITWFQAQEACANAGKRLPTSAEWQMGADGTPDPGPDNRATDCNSAGNEVSSTVLVAPASPRAGPSTWPATWKSGWRTGRRSRRTAPAGGRAAMTGCASRGRVRLSVAPVR